ncbi:MAG: hypothetical protein IPJ55_13275 [Chloracidobacterium sp.]|nr:hypothetical protein [Chloracidobacterium sp.]
MKQFYITFLMILSFGAAAIASGQAVTVTAPTQFVLVGSTPTLAITASDTTGLGILGYRGEITLQPERNRRRWRQCRLQCLGHDQQLVRRILQ